MTFHWLARRAAKTPRPAGPSSRLRLESLEDRTTPSTFTVNTKLDVVDPADGKLSLREAITRANDLAGADVIVLPAGVYKLALSGAGEDANATGDFDVTGAVTIRGTGKGLTFIDGQQLDRVFDVIGGAPSEFKAVFEALTIRNGNVTDAGGGILFGNADLVVRDSVVTGNRASQDGGGISSVGVTGAGNAKLVRCTVSRNVAGINGGGVFISRNDSLLTVTGSTVRRNLAENDGGISGGTINLSNTTVIGNDAEDDTGGISAGTATLTNCTVSGNSAGRFVGGISAARATLTNCTVSDNSAISDIGGILSSDRATLTNCTVSDNSAGAAGGGIFARTATLTNCTVSGNSAGTFGGGVFISTSATIQNCTIVENSAASGGGVFRDTAIVQVIEVRNTIIALNLVGVGGTGADVNGNFVSQGHNLIGDGAGAGGSGFTNGTNGDLVGTAANRVDPRIGALANNGGKTRTHALLAGSPAIDMGDNSLLPPTDQRGPGFPRKKDGNGNGVAVVDIGAFER